MQTMTAQASQDALSSRVVCSSLQACHEGPHPNHASAEIGLAYHQLEQERWWVRGGGMLESPSAVPSWDQPVSLQMAESPAAAWPPWPACRASRHGWQRQGRQCHLRAACAWPQEALMWPLAGRQSALHGHWPALHRRSLGEGRHSCMCMHWPGVQSAGG